MPGFLDYKLLVRREVSENLGSPTRPGDGHLVNKDAVAETGVDARIE